MSQIVGIGAERLYMNEDAQGGWQSAFDIDAPARARTAASAREITAHGTFEGRAQETVEVTVSRVGDLMGECFFHVELDGPASRLSDPFELLERVEYVIGGAVVESYAGRALAAVATFDRLARPSVVGNVVVLPLRLCTSAASSTWLPLVCLRFHEVKVRLTTPARLLGGVVSRTLHVETACLDSDERRRVCMADHHELRVHPKASAEFRVDLEPLGGRAAVVDVDLTPWLGDTAVRDLIVEVCPGPCGAGARKTWQPVSEISVHTQVERMRLDAAMAGRAVPRHQYGIDAFDERCFVYYLPFDNAPAEPFATATLRVAAANGLRLRIAFADLEGLQAGGGRVVADVHVTARTFNAIRTSSGMAALTMGAPADFRRLVVAPAPARPWGSPTPSHAPSVSRAAARVTVIPSFLSDDKCDRLRLRVLERSISIRIRGSGSGSKGCGDAGMRPTAPASSCWLQEDADALALLQRALDRAGRGLAVVPGSRVTYGVYSGGGGGLARHADEPLQGGDLSLLVYLNDVTEGAGGTTKFYASATAAEPWKVCRPVRGCAVLFDVGAPHEAEPVAEGHLKVVVACEVRKGASPL